jgi:transposase
LDNTRQRDAARSRLGRHQLPYFFLLAFAISWPLFIDEPPTLCSHREVDRLRAGVERTNNRLKRFRRMAARYKKLACRYEAMLHVPGILPWLGSRLCKETLGL